LVAASLAASACGSDSGSSPSWSQWGGSPEHRNAVQVSAQPLSRAIATVAYDTLVEDEKADNDGELIVHYQSPLVVDDDVYMMWKAGTYTGCPVVNMVKTCELYRRNTQVWSEKGYRWENDNLVEKWMFTSDWKPSPSGGGFEPMFQPAVAGDFIFVPGAGGTVYKLTRKDGLAVTRIQPYGTDVDADRYVVSPITAASDGSIYYNTVKYDHNAPFAKDVAADLVVVGADGKVRTASYQTLVTGAPKPSDMCRGVFTTRITPRPWPPADDANGAVLPPTMFPCLSQRPPWNAAPALAADGTLFLASHAHASDRVSYILAVNSKDLSTKWVRSLAKIFNDGCGGDFLPIDATDGDKVHLFDCRVGARMGVDPSTNEMPSGRAADDSSSSPVVLPDGSVLFGAFTGYNIERGHLLKLSPTGDITATFGFGWDVTPGVWVHGGTYSIIVKDNYYTFDENGADMGPYFIRQLDANLKTEWAFQSNNTKSCTRKDDGTLDCTDDHPHGFEWCINAPAIDKDGTVYGNSEDGNVYAIPQGGNPAQVKAFFTSMALGAAYTPLAIDGAGRLISLNNGKMTVIGK
jgi:outer membrane protein assembly factor BamB